MKIPHTGKMDSIGRIVIPKAIRAKYGMSPGGLVTVWIDIEEKTEQK